MKPGDGERTERRCRVCGKRENPVAASLQQFVFEYDSCRCNSPRNLNEALKASIRARPAELIAAVESKSAETELTLERDSFPLDRYKPVYKLGSGASGVVYLALDRVLGKKVAIKILRTLSPEFVMAFQAEARTTSRLKHKYIIDLLDFGITLSSAPYMVLEFVLGPSLEEVVNHVGPLNVTDFFAVFRRTCEALAYAHANKVFHRDLKPGNILLTQETDGSFSIRVIDFGLAKIRSDQMDASQDKGLTLVGTPLYMSPDQGMGRPFDSRSEIYSLGCVMFESLAGVPPFRAESALELLNLHADIEPPRIAEVLTERGATLEEASIPPSVEEIVRKCIEKDPDKRFQTVSDVLSALNDAEQYAYDSPVSESSERHGAPDSHRPWIACGLLLLTTLVAVSYFYLHGQSVDVLNSSHETPVKRESEEMRFFGTIHGKPLELLINPNQEVVRLNGGLDASEIVGLERYKFMTELDLSNNTHSDEVTSRIRSPYLRILRLNNTPVKTLEYVSKLQNLQCLNLASTSIDGAAVKRLKQLPNLIELDVRDTPLTDEDLYYLAEIPTLLKLTLSTEKYSRASLLALKERLPACSMKFGVGKTQPLDLIRQLVNGKQFAEAERQCRQAMEVIEDIQGKDAQPLSAYGYWAAVSCLNQGNSNQGKSYCKRAIEIAEKTRFKIYLPDSYLLLVQTYDEAGQQKIANTYVERAFDALKARDGYTVTGAELALRLSESYTSSSNSEKSEDWLNICDMYVKNLKSKNIKFANRDYTFVLAPLHLHLSELCYGKKQFEQSKEHALIALRYLKEHTTERPSVNQKQSKHHEELLSFAETRFAAIAAHEKRFSDALSHQRKAIEYLNSINEPTEQALLYLRSLEELARTDSRKVDHD